MTSVPWQQSQVVSECFLIVVEKKESWVVPSWQLVSWKSWLHTEKVQWLIQLSTFKDKIISIFPLQVLLNMLEFGMNPQRALDAPRAFVQYDQAGKFLTLCVNRCFLSAPYTKELIKSKNFKYLLTSLIFSSLVCLNFNISWVGGKEKKNCSFCSKIITGWI